MHPFPGIPIIESPLFERLTKDFSVELKRIALDLHLKGYTVIDFPDDQIYDKAELIKKQLDNESFGKKNPPIRMQDAWKTSKEVKDIATNPAILDMLSRLYGRKAIPFQTLNFKFGSEQHYHSDAVHFSSSPERFMCGVWVALEDITESNGPLVYYPGSHAWPILSNEMIGCNVMESTHEPSQEIYHDAWKAMIDSYACKPETFLAKKGQALIWAANLLHGGLPIINRNHTRWSQVTHYFFDNCCYYTPMLSNSFLGNIFYRDIIDIATNAPVQNISCGQVVPEEVLRFKGGTKLTKLPEYFDVEAYLKLHEDVRAAGVDPKEHWLKHGRFEGRKLR